MLLHKEKKSLENSKPYIHGKYYDGSHSLLEEKKSRRWRKTLSNMDLIISVTGRREGR
jgi:hypothetical protein